MQHSKKSKHILSMSTMIIVVGIISLCWPTSIRAQTITDQVIDTQTQRVQVLNNIIGIASWLWIIPAKLAGILMTNYFVYGSAFYLVDYLFKFWQIIRTFALYGLGLYFVGYILYSWFHPEDPKSKIAELFKNTLIAGVLISMSRWLIAASVDLSIVFTSAVAAIPSQIYEQERTKKQQCFSTPKTVPIDADLGIDADLMGNPDNYESPKRIQIKPEGSDISGPLMFFGSSVLKFFDMVYLPEQQLQGSGSSNDNQQRGLSRTLIIVIVKAILALMLVIPMVILVVVNLIRVIYLRLWIVFSPGIVLMNIFEVKISDQLDKYLSRQNILGLIMQPVAVVAMLSVGLIFIIELTSVFNLCIPSPDPNENPLLATPIKEGIDAPIGQIGSEIGAETTLGASLSAVGDFVGGITGELIMAIFVIVLVRSLIKVGFSFSELTKETASSITDNLGKIASTVPIIPLPGLGRVGTSAAGDFVKGGFGLKKQNQNKLAEQEGLLKEKFGMGTGEISPRKLLDLNRKAEKAVGLEELKQSIEQETDTHTILATSAKKIVSSWLASSSGLTENNNLLRNKLKLSNLAGVNWSENEEELQKIWEKGSTYNQDAYKLLNRLFGRGSTIAADSSSTINQFGPFKTDT